MIEPPEIGELKQASIGEMLTVIEREEDQCRAGVVRCIFDKKAYGDACEIHRCSIGHRYEPDYVGLIWLRPEDFALARLTKGVKR